MNVKEIMTKNVYCVLPSATIFSVAQLMKRHNIGDVCVCDENNTLIGIITDRDITIQCVAAGVDSTVARVESIMTQCPICVTPDTSLEECANIMAKEQIHRLPIIDNGKVVGIISLGDLAFYLENDALIADTLRAISIPIRGAMPTSKAA